MNDDPFSIENLKIEMPSAEAAEAGKATKATKGRFVRIPGEWAHRLCRAKHLGTYKVAVYLLHLNWKSRGKPIRLPNAVLRQMGVGRDAKWRALLELETMGLIEVSRRDRKSPEVSLKNL
jgi:hypothetical protein